MSYMVCNLFHGKPSNVWLTLKMDECAIAELDDLRAEFSLF